MKNCSFSIEFQQTASEVVQLAGNAIKGAGGEFSGNDSEGQFKLSTGIGSVKGSFTISEGAIHITISDKPAFIGCSRIESEIRKYLNR